MRLLFVLGVCVLGTIRHVRAQSSNCWHSDDNSNGNCDGTSGFDFYVDWVRFCIRNPDTNQCEACPTVFTHNDPAALQHQQDNYPDEDYYASETKWYWDGIQSNEDVDCPNLFFCRRTCEAMGYGTCTSLSSTDSNGDARLPFHCACVTHRTGVLCETYTCSLSCGNGQHNGACNACICNDGYNGTNCETALSCVATNNATHDGTDGNFYCINSGTVGGVTGACNCTSCALGYEGAHCATPVQCPAGYTGPACDQCLPGYAQVASACVPQTCQATNDVNDDGVDGNMYCVNGGTVSGVTGSCQCTCPLGYAGADCVSCAAGYAGENCTASNCYATSDNTKDGSDGTIFCGPNVLYARGTTGNCYCVCRARYHGDLCEHVNVCTCPNGYLTLTCTEHGAEQCRGCVAGYHLLSDKTCEEDDCTCTNGFGAENCPAGGGHFCGSCYNGYTLVGDRCKPNVCTCAHGVATVGRECLRNNSASCVSCDAGYNIGGSGECEPNTCTCAHGTGATAEACQTHQTARCAACELGYRLVGTVCKRNRCICTGAGKPYGAGCTTHLQPLCGECDAGFNNIANPGHCVVNTCVCDNGTPAQGSACLVNGSQTCAVCNPGFTGPECTPAQCACTAGTPHADCMFDGELRCSGCDDGYHLSGDLVCEENICRCPNGVGTRGTQCPVHGKYNCSTCTAPKALVKVRYSQCLRSVAYNAQCDTDSIYECAACACDHGESGTGCSNPGESDCTAFGCDDGYSVVSGVCTPQDCDYGFETYHATGRNGLLNCDETVSGKTGACLCDNKPGPGGHFATYAEQELCVAACGEAGLCTFSNGAVATCGCLLTTPEYTNSLVYTDAGLCVAPQVFGKDTCGCTVSAPRSTDCGGNSCSGHGECVYLGLHSLSYTCMCDDGWTGSACNEGDCQHVQCNHGECVGTSSGTECVCNPGYTGAACDQLEDSCIGHSCQHGAACAQNGANAYTCACVAGYEGTFCQIDTDDCVGVDCGVRGACKDKVNAHECVCERKYTIGDDNKCSKLSKELRNEKRQAALPTRNITKSKRENVAKVTIQVNQLSYDQQKLFETAFVDRTPKLTIATEQLTSSTDIAMCDYNIAQETSTEKEILVSYGVGHYSFVCDDTTLIARQRETATETMISCWEGTDWGAEESIVGEFTCGNTLLVVGSLTSGGDCDQCDVCDADTSNDNACFDLCGVAHGDSSTCDVITFAQTGSGYQVSTNGVASTGDNPNVTICSAEFVFAAESGVTVHLNNTTIDDSTPYTATLSGGLYAYTDPGSSHGGYIHVKECCPANTRVLFNECVACLPGTTNTAGDDAAGGNTECAVGVCLVNEKVENNACVACLPGSTRAAGDLTTSANTTCTVEICEENEHVSAHTCVACSAREGRDAGDDATGDDTTCTPLVSGTCAEAMNSDVYQKLGCCNC